MSLYKRLFKTRFSTLFSLLIIFIVSFIALRSLISVPFYTSHDGFTHTARIAAYLGSLRDGQFPVRWAENLNGQFGSPIFVYSYPLPYFFGALLHLSGLSYEASFRTIMALGYILGGVGAYFWLSRRFGNQAGLVGSIFYLWVPYHFLNVYVRAAVAENLAYAFLPFVLLAIEEIYRSKRQHVWWLILTFSLTATLLSHNLVSAISLPIFVVWSLIWAIKNNSWPKRIANFLGLIVPFLLAAFIYLPDFFERHFVRFDQGISYYADHFVAWWQLVRSPWGYGFDFPGTANDAMSFQIGLGHLLMLSIVLVLILARSFKKPLFLFQKQNWEACAFLILFGVLLLFLIEHPLSRTIWTITPAVKTIVDFPWRLLGLISLILSYFASFLVFQTKRSNFLAIFLIASVLIANRNHLRVNEAVTFPDSVYENYTGTSTAGSSEYTPIWRKSLQFPPLSPRVDNVDQKLVRVKTNTASVLEFSLDPNPGTPIRINRFYFPATNIFYNGNPLIPGIDWEIISHKTNPSPEAFDDSGLIMLKKVNPEGGQYKLVFQETPLRDFANKISLVTLVAIALWVLIRKK